MSALIIDLDAERIKRTPTSSAKTDCTALFVSGFAVWFAWSLYVANRKDTK